MRKTLAFIVFLFSSFSLSALEWDTLRAGTSLSFVIDSSENSAPVRTMTTWSAGIDLLYNPFFETRFDLSFRGHYYAWVGEEAVPESDHLFGDVCFLLLPSLRASIGLRFLLGEDLILRWDLAPVFELPFSLGTVEEETENLEENILSWWYGEGRFFYLDTRISLEYVISEDFGVELFGGFRYPVESFSRESTPLHRSILEGGFFFSWRIPRLTPTP